MKCDTKLIMAYKYFEPLEKLLLIVISEEEINVKPFKEPCRITSQEMGDTIGETRTSIQKLLWALIEQGLIESKVVNRQRITFITNLARKLIKERVVLQTIH